jgi:hypothetical protein
MFNQSSPSNALAQDQQQLLRLNIDFLKLLISASTAASAAPPLTLRGEQTVALGLCEEAGLQRMAACGFSLFSLSLHRADLWQQAARRSQAQVNEPHYESHAAEHAQAFDRICSGFMECALFFAWHLAQQQPRQARLLLGMSEDCTAIVAGLDLWQCRHIAQTQHSLLSPRWRHHPYFWSDLLRYGNSGEAQHFKFAQLLGSQLLAQELEPSAILRLSSTD